MKRAILVFLLTVLFASLPNAAPWDPPYPVREIPYPGLADIAMATADYAGPVIYYNPYLVQQFGPDLTTFFRAHEYGHIHLGHVEKLGSLGGQLSLVVDRKRIELEADSYAAAVLAGSGDWAALEAAYRFFYSQGHGRYSPIYPTGYERAQVIADFLYGRRR